MLWSSSQSTSVWFWRTKSWPFWIPRIITRVRVEVGVLLSVVLLVLLFLIVIPPNSPFGLFSLRIVSGAASLLLLQQQTGRLDQTDTSFFCLIQGQQLETKPGNSLAMRTKRKLKVQTATNQAHVWRHQEQAQGMR